MDFVIVMIILGNLVLEAESLRTGSIDYKQSMSGYHPLFLVYLALTSVGGLILAFVWTCSSSEILQGVGWALLSLVGLSFFVRKFFGEATRKFPLYVRTESGFGIILLLLALFVKLKEIF